MKDCAIILFSATIRLAIQRSCCTNRFFLLVQQFFCAQMMHKTIMIIFCIKKREKKGKNPHLCNLNTLETGNLPLLLENRIMAQYLQYCINRTRTIYAVRNRL